MVRDPQSSSLAMLHPRTLSHLSRVKGNNFPQMPEFVTSSEISFSDASAVSSTLLQQYLHKSEMHSSQDIQVPRASNSQIRMLLTTGVLDWSFSMPEIHLERDFDLLHCVYDSYQERQSPIEIDSKPQCDPEIMNQNGSNHRLGLDLVPETGKNPTQV